MSSYPFYLKNLMTRPLSLNELIQRAEQGAHDLYAGELTPHRSCGISLAELYGQRTPPYQSLRRGGITGHGQCGAIKAGEMILGEIFGDPAPTGPVTDTLRSALIRYRELWQDRVDKGQSETIICNDLTGQFDDFRSPERHAFCTRLAATVSGCIAQTLAEHDIEPRFHLPKEVLDAHAANNDRTPQ